MTKEIPLTKGFTALVDDEDYEWLSQWKWCTHPRGYATRRGNGGKLVLMHKVIFGKIASKEEIDHINRVKTDNRRSNLRIATHSDNGKNKPRQSNNKSGYKGVDFRSDLKKPWRASINIPDESKAKKHRQIMIGCFCHPIDAAVAYDVASIRYFGDFAYTNFPRENYASMGMWE